MLKRIVISALVIIAVQCATSCPSAAQNPANCLTTQSWGFFDAIPLGWFYVSTYPGTYQELIAAWKASCPSPNAGKETCPTCPSGGKPISLATGNTYIEQADLKIPGLGGGLVLARTWNSVWPSSQSTFQVGIFGANWRSTYEERIIMGFDNRIKYSRSNGSFWSFGIGGSGWVVSAPANVTATLNTDTSVNAYYVLTFENGEQRRFDKTTGNLIAIIDRNGNTTTVAYDASGRLSTVTDAASRQLTFSYGSSGNLVTGVTSSVGISLSYTYDAQGRLTTVTEPDLTTLNFAYNSQSLITSVTDSNGKVLESHTYDSQARGLTSTRAGGVEALSITYPNP